ncbi:hypothetical protein PISL3812_07086 [Talaromyces islandicus]|uniref:Rhodopsin domain-containing protein n=1 Tax=Talaromyces islandicus TaxID=28573 RepID=A0A0U1M3B0_TALIS|nr:hypothetical protein PISL3812_07086 [Talaromyces islandicus]
MAPSPLGWEEIKISIALSAISALAVALRFTSRLVKRAKLGLEDWIALASLVSISAMLSQLILWVVLGNSAKHSSALSVGEITVFNKIFLANQFTYAVTSTLIKLTIILFYRRVFITPEFRFVANTLSIGCILWAIVALLGFALQCRPLSRQWDSTVSGTCDNQIAFIEGIQGINIFLDVSIFAVPWPMTWNLHGHWQYKVSLSGIFLLGGLVVGASTYRMIAITQIEPDDMTYTIYSSEIWTFVEPCIGLVCACAPMIRSLVPVAYAATKKSAFSSSPSSSAYCKSCSKNSHMNEIQRDGCGDMARLEVPPSSYIVADSVNSVDDTVHSRRSDQVTTTSIEMV